MRLLAQNRLALRCLIAASVLCAGHASAQQPSVNIAAAGSASQSSNYLGSYFAQRGIDGVLSPSHVFSMTHTGNDQDSFWQVEFPVDVPIYEVRLTNRADCCATRLSNFRVSVFDGMSEVFGQDEFVGSGSVALGATHVVTLPAGGAVGDRVRVQFLGRNNDNNGYLHMREVEVISDPIGQPFCSPANPTSLGAPAEIHAFGSAVAGGNPLALVATGLPSMAAGYFLCSETTGSAMPPASQGVVCVGGNIGRIAIPVLQVDTRGRRFGRFVDTLALPGNPPSAVTAGQTWYFQAWFRDAIGGVATSNFTDAVCIGF